jgi:hypothetical protein
VEEVTSAAAQASGAVTAARQLVADEHVNVRDMNVPAASAALQKAVEHVDGLEATVRSVRSPTYHCRAARPEQGCLCIGRASRIAVALRA